MPLSDAVKKARKDLIWLLEIEVAQRIDDKAWTSAGSGTYYIVPAARKPSRIREIDRTVHELIEYSEEASLANCQATPASWFFDSATGRLYVHATDVGSGSGSGGGADIPSSGDYYIAAYFWKLFCDGLRPAPNEVVYNGRPYDARLKAESIPEFSMEVSNFLEAGVRQAWGDLKLANGDGGLDQDLVDYIWENKVFVLKVGEPGDTYAQFSTVSRGRTGSTTWDEDEITVGIEDPLQAED